MLLRWQDFADILEAVVWERAKTTRHGRSWQKVASDMAKSLAKTWPLALCTEEQASICAVALTADALKHRFQKLAKKKISPATARAKAENLIGMTQLYLPPAEMPLWTYFLLTSCRPCSRWQGRQGQRWGSATRHQGCRT